MPSVTRKYLPFEKAQQQQLLESSWEREDIDEYVTRIAHHELGMIRSIKPCGQQCSSNPLL